MNTNMQMSLWKRQVSGPVAAMAIAISIVSTLAVFESQTGLPASVHTNPIYGSLPVHSAAPTPVIRRTSSTSSVSSRTANALHRLRQRLIKHRISSKVR